MQQVKIHDICLELSKTEFALIGLSLQSMGALVEQKYIQPMDAETQDLLNKSVDATFFCGKEYHALMDKVSKITNALELGVKYT